jgi:hypothetical protein
MESITEMDAPTNGASGRREVDHDGEDLKRTLLAGVLGAVVASAGYLIYTRLEEEHKDALRRSVMKFVEEKVGEIRSQFKI